MKKVCQECSIEIYGREDKKFCSDQCRNTYNNRLNSDARNFVRNINNILRKNRRILEELNVNGTTKTSRDKLLLKGFNFNYYTNTYTTKQGKTYYFCYDQGYIPINDELYAIVIKQDYID